jgi:hypothetical protein
MVLDWLAKGKAKTVPELLVKRQFTEAVDLARTELAARPRSQRLRLQLADALEAAGRGREAIPFLKGLADELAADGFAAKAIALLKRIQKIDPQGTLDARIATLIQERTSRPVAAPPSPAALEPRTLELPEIGLEALSGVAVDAAARAEPPASAPPPRTPPEDEGDDDEIIDLGGAREDGRPVLATPLFPDFSPEDLLAVIQGLQLLTFAPGDIVVAEGEPGGGLYLVSTGTVKAWTKDARVHYLLARTLQEGDFFGEVSVLTGQPRTATVTAAARCELLELDRETLDAITATHPAVRDVLQRFYEQRVGT